MKKDNWNGKKEENVILEYNIEQTSSELVDSYDNTIITLNKDFQYEKPDKMDYLVAASCGVLTGLIDLLWIGEFSLSSAQNWGSTKVEAFVIKVAQLQGYKKNTLEGAIRHLEKTAPMATDKLINEWGGGYYHHFRDFSHHASIIGLVFSVLTQFTGTSYGTNTTGEFTCESVICSDLIGKTFEEKIYRGVIMWALHLVSDMAGSSSNPGKGTGIPGPILSLLKALSALPHIGTFKFKNDGKDISISTMLSMIFNGTAFQHTRTTDLIRFDLRTELGLYAAAAKQSIPVLVNHCFIRAFYFVRRFIMEIGRVRFQSIVDVKQMIPRRFLPYNENRCIIRMDTVSSGIFSIVDETDAISRAVIHNSNSAGSFWGQIILRTNFAGIAHLAIAIKKDITTMITSQTNLSKSNGAIKKIDADNFSVSDFDINITCEIDNIGIYEYAFYRMVTAIIESKEHYINLYSAKSNCFKSLFCLEDEEQYMMDQIQESSYDHVLRETGNMMMRLFTLYHIDYFAFNNGKTTRLHMPFFRIENSERIAYMFSGFLSSPYDREDIETIIKEYQLDKIVIVALIEIDEQSSLYKSLIEKAYKEYDNLIKLVTIKVLFSLISETEYEVYLSYVIQYHDEIKKQIGYKTTIIPSSDTLKTFKEKFETEMQNFPIAEILKQDGIFEGQIRIIENNLLNKGRTNAVVCCSSYADSFISSEWYYQTHSLSSALEQTAIIAGYLKSVEQLLFSIIKLSINTGKRIKRLGGERNELIDFTDDNISFVDTSLGALINYCRHYSELWDVNSFVKNYISNKLNDFRIQYRNDHFHKDNIYCEEEIKAIRNNTIFRNCSVLLRIPQS